MNTTLFDLTIVGAGPTGLYAAFYAGFRGMKVKLIDSLEELGGQITALYPEKAIFDVAGFPNVSGKALVKGLVDQAMSAKPTVCLNERVNQIQLNADKTYTLVSDKESHLSKAILITIGVGAFTPKRLPIPEPQKYEGKGLSYFVPQLSKYQGKRVLIVGGGDSAVDWALNLLPIAKSITLVHRRDGFRAHEESVRQLKESAVNLKLFYEVKALRGDPTIQEAVIFNNKTNAEETIAIDEVIGCLGFETSAGPVTQWGLTMAGRDVAVSTKMETNLPGIYAAGDITAYPGKVKLISVGFGEAAIAVNNAAAYLNPGASVFPGHSSSKSE